MITIGIIIMPPQYRDDKAQRTIFILAKVDNFCEPKGSRAKRDELCDTKGSNTCQEGRGWAMMKARVARLGLSFIRFSAKIGKDRCRS